MPELGDKLGASALEVLRGRGIEVSLGVSISRAGPDTVTFTDGREVPCRTLIWTAGVAASPLISTLGAEAVRGRLVVTPELAVPGLNGVFATGDAAAVPDLSKPDDAICPPTAQHAMRQGRRLAANILAALRGRPSSRTSTGTSAWSSTSAARTPSPNRSASNCAACPHRRWPAATTGRRCAPTSPRPA